MTKLQEFAMKNKGMFWDTNPNNLDDEIVFERVLAYGNWEDFRSVEETIGKEKARDIFIRRAYMPRTNLRESTINLFTHYFHVIPPSDRPLSRAI